MARRICGVIRRGTGGLRAAGSGQGREATESLNLTSDDAIAYAGVRAKLERAGTPIGPLDTLIASQAVGRNLTLVTNNEREFRRVTGLTIANWTR
jgi:tRNA(fMet)-specific endonuclease VapC